MAQEANFHRQSDGTRYFLVRASGDGAFVNIVQHLRYNPRDNQLTRKPFSLPLFYEDKTFGCLTRRLFPAGTFTVASKAKNKNRNAYFEWHQKVGRFEFRKRFGRDYNQEMEDDKLLMTELWQAVKEQWDRDIKLRKGKLKGPLGVLHIDEIEYSGPLRTIHSSGDRPPNLARPEKHCSNYVDRSHPRKVDGMRDMLDRLRLFDARGIDFTSVVLQFIAVYPYTVALSRSGELLVYPAEVSITHCTLRNGTSARFSRLVNFLPKQFYGSGLPEWDQEEVVKNAQKLDVSLKQPQGVTPAEAWWSLMEHRNSRAITLCDANQIAAVDSALYFLASTAGPEQVDVHKELMRTIITVQDLVKALLRHRGKATAAEFERVDKEFKKLRETALCCSYHGKKPPQAPSRQLCPVAKAETLIESMETILFAENLPGFRDLDSRAQGHADNDGPLSATAHVEDSSGSAPQKGEQEEEHDAGDVPQLRGFRLRYEVVDESVAAELFSKPTTPVDLAKVIPRMLRQNPTVMAEYLRH